jgi:hypothetical protein
MGLNYIWMCLNNRSLCWFGHFYTIGALAAPGRVFTTEAFAAPRRDYNTEALVAPGHV